MRISRIWILAMCGVVSGAQSADLPEQKSGLGEVITVQTGPGNLPPIAKVCVDKGNQFYLGAKRVLEKSCTKLATRVAGSTVTRDGVCKFGLSQVTTHGVTTFHGDDEYRAEVHSHWDPPLAGNSDTTLTITAKWLSASCGARMKPGDVMANGRIVSADGKTVSADGKTVSGNAPTPAGASKPH